VVRDITILCIVGCTGCVPKHCVATTTTPALPTHAHTCLTVPQHQSIVNLFSKVLLELDSSSLFFHDSKWESRFKKKIMEMTNSKQNLCCLLCCGDEGEAGSREDGGAGCGSRRGHHCSSYWSWGQLPTSPTLTSRGCVAVFMFQSLRGSLWLSAALCVYIFLYYLLCPFFF